MRIACYLALYILPWLFAIDAQETESLLRISVADAEQNLVKRVVPVYPRLAQSAHIEGKVVLSAIISKQGKVESLKVVSGHPVLAQAALEAVKQWEYKPYVLDGQPAGVRTIIEV